MSVILKMAATAPTGQIWLGSRLEITYYGSYMCVKFHACITNAWFGSKWGLSIRTKSASGHSGTLGEIEIFKMAAKMTAANIKPAITALLVHLGTYFLGGIIGLATKE